MGIRFPLPYSDKAGECKDCFIYVISVNIDPRITDWEIYEVIFTVLSFLSCQIIKNKSRNTVICWLVGWLVL